MKISRNTFSLVALAVITLAVLIFCDMPHGFAVVIYR